MAVLIILSLCFLNGILCYESGSSELNRIEFTPQYETIIYSDIADIIKGYENNMNSPIEAITNNDDNSESDENIEDLLVEYQHYLDKAHKQRRNYLEKSRAKNKVPLVQLDRYSKSRAAQTNKHDDYYDVKYNNPTALHKSSFIAPLDFLIPINMMKSGMYSNYGELSKTQEVTTTNSAIGNISPDVKLLQLPPAMPSSVHESIQSSCYCDTDTFPCECGCKQCLISSESRRKHDDEEKPTSKVAVTNSSYKHPRGWAENTINIRVKVDVQFPQVQQNFEELLKNKTEKSVEHTSFSKETNVNLPFPFFGFPFPLEMTSHKKLNKDTNPVHKITIHRKKKSKSNSNGRRHRKKLITFHDFRLKQRSSTTTTRTTTSTTTESSLDESYNGGDSRQNLESKYQMNSAKENNNITQKLEPEQSDISINNTTYFTDTKYTGNTTEDAHKNENSIETEYIKAIVNLSTEEPPLREKRQANGPINLTSETASPSQNENKSDKANDTIKKTIKTVYSSDDAELLYWPKDSNAIVNLTNITTLILDKENNKVKLNLSTEGLKRNRSVVLAEVLFGKVDWNDVDTVAPLFMSSMGKYIRGVLSFCSGSICHSMKCENKTCVHRTCPPTARKNNKGHCTGSDATDSVVSMESIMDLPSNIAYEIVDILQHNMLGELFGKASLCISSKCITFTASKKTFTKIRCTPKELDGTGHCPINKNSKIM